jgi:peroxiredoxin Q/BCP
MLTETQAAPDFTLLDDTGTQRSLSDEVGKWVVIYFYPKDDTPGCTKEACAIRDIYDEFAQLGVTVFGVSKDSVASHAKFKVKYQLPFTLLSDETGEMIDAYGALQEKRMFGKSFQGVVRMSYLVNPAGEVAKVYPTVSPTEHAHEILKDLSELQKS